MKVQMELGHRDNIKAKTHISIQKSTARDKTLLTLKQTQTLTKTKTKRKRKSKSKTKIKTQMQSKRQIQRPTVRQR
jgi:hypothetical protein